MARRGEDRVEAGCADVSDLNVLIDQGIVVPATKRLSVFLAEQAPCQPSEQITTRQALDEQRDDRV